MKKFMVKSSLIQFVLKIEQILTIKNITFFGLTLYGPNSFFRRFSGHNLR